MICKIYFSQFDRVAINKGGWCSEEGKLYLKLTTPFTKQKSIDAIICNLFQRYGNLAFKLLIGIILARLLTPADYGLIGIITVFFALARVFVNSGFGSAYIQKQDATEIDASTIFFFNLFNILYYLH